MRTSLTVLAVVTVCFSVFAANEEKEEVALDKARLLIYNLENGSTQVASGAARELASLSPEVIMRAQAIQSLDKILQSDAASYFVKEAAVQSLADMHDNLGDNGKSEVKKSLSAVATNNEQNDNLRVMAIEALSKMLDEESYEDRRIATPILRLASDKGESEQIRNAATRFEIIYKGKGNVSSILQSLENASAPAQLQIKSMETLKLWIAANTGAGSTGLSGSDARKLAEWAGESPRPVEVRIDMIYIVAQVHKAGTKVSGVPNVFEKIMEKEENPEVKLAAVKALGICGDADSIKTLVKIYEDNKGEDGDKVAVRAAVCEALGEFFPVVAARGDFRRYSLQVSKASETLVQALSKDPSALVCIAAATSMANMAVSKFDRDEAAKALVAALYDQDPQVVMAAYTALKAISGKDFGKDAKKDWEDWYRDNRDKLRPRR